MNKAEKISHGNIKTWEKKREAFFKTNPVCSVCGKKITLYTETGKCAKCRAKKSKKKFESKNPGYHKKYNKIRDEKRRNENKGNIKI